MTRVDDKAAVPPRVQDLRVAVPACALNDEELRRQRERYGRLTGSVAGMQREGDELVIDFEPGFPRETLDEAIAVERECCPFFQLEFDQERRRLTVGVREKEHLPALDGIAAALGRDPDQRVS